MYCDRLQRYCIVPVPSLKHAKIGHAGLAALGGLHDSMHLDPIDLMSDEENLNEGGHGWVDEDDDALLSFPN